MWHDLTSAFTSYGVALFTLVFHQDMTTYAAFFGIILVIVRIMGDIPKAIEAWKKLFYGDTDDESGEHGGAG